MSTHVIGFKPPDETWRKMKEVYDVCKKNGLETPDYVEKFFNYEEPDDHGVEVDIEEMACVQKYDDDMREGFELFVEKLPPDIKVIRFYNSW